MLRVDRVQVLDEGDEVVLVLWCSSSLARIFPVQVQAIKIVLQDKFDRTGDKTFSFHRVFCHRAVLGASFIPTTNSKSYLEWFIFILVCVFYIYLPLSEDGSTLATWPS